MTVAALVSALIAYGCPPAEAATLVANAAVEMAASKPRSRHAEAQARYQSRKATKASEMIRNDQNDAKERSPIPPKRNLNITTTSSDKSSEAVPAVMPSPRKELFGRGVSVLTELTGKPVSSVKSLIGRWLKQVDDEAIHVLAAIDEANSNFVADPVSWISASLRTKSRPSFAKPPTARQTILKNRDTLIDETFGLFTTPTDAGTIIDIPHRLPQESSRALGPPIREDVPVSRRWD